MPNNANDLAAEIIAEKPEPSVMADQMIAESEADIAAQIQEDFAKNPPDVQTPPAAQETIAVSVDATAAIGLKDDLGNFYDPNIHTDPPKKKADGSWALKRGRKIGQKTAATIPGVISNSTQDIVDASKRNECRQAASKHAEQFFFINRFALGEEFAPLKVKTPDMELDERRDVTEALADFYFHYGIPNMPPWLALAATMGFYYYARTQMPVTKSKVAKAWDWLSKKWKGE